MRLRLERMVGMVHPREMHEAYLTTSQSEAAAAEAADELASRRRQDHSDSYKVLLTSYQGCDALQSSRLGQDQHLAGETAALHCPFGSSCGKPRTGTHRK